MDHALTREESVRLMQLLKLPMEQYGNFSLMRKAFLRECKNLHPDKGGNPELAKELITLYRKLEEQVSSLNVDEEVPTSQQVCDDFFLYLKDWEQCHRRQKPCVCLFCLLRDNHETKSRQPKCWGSCYCFQCFVVWFGIEYCWMSWLSWRAIIAELPFSTLNI
ncbi:small t antigen [Bat polyomavirus 6a]|uniref:Small t antigen n=1 Tax=Bat polyomavirus 6a TaxID=1623685 RepID=A0A0D5ZYL6_9POLY|nr:small t antigen [Bat polyomavirus 6a]BAQ55553.1 small t antigen [Bat polyomavirus 6a]